MYVISLFYTKRFTTQALPESWRRRISDYFSSEHSTPTSSDDPPVSVTARNNVASSGASSVELTDLSPRDPSEFVSFDDEVSAADVIPAHQPNHAEDAHLAASTVVDVSDSWSSIVNPSMVSRGHAAPTVTTVQRGRSLAGDTSLPSNTASHMGSFPSDRAGEGSDGAVVELQAQVLALEHELLQKEDVVRQKELAIQQKELVIQENQHVIQQKELVIQQKDTEIRRLQEQSD